MSLRYFSSLLRHIVNKTDSEGGYGYQFMAFLWSIRPEFAERFFVSSALLLLGIINRIVVVRSQSAVLQQPLISSASWLSPAPRFHPLAPFSVP